MIFITSKRVVHSNVLIVGDDFVNDSLGVLIYMLREDRYNDSMYVLCMYGHHI